MKQVCPVCGALLMELTPGSYCTTCNRIRPLTQQEVTVIHTINTTGPEEEH